MADVLDLQFDVQTVDMVDKVPVPEGEWIQTYSGVAFDLENPQPYMIRLMDVAHALSQTCRFTGHTSKFYSVAQHSVMVSYLSNPQNALVGLLHDFTEAYLTDLATPVKRLLPEYYNMEKRIWLAGSGKWGLPEELPSDVKEADKAALGWEAWIHFNEEPINGWCDFPYGLRDLVPAELLQPLYPEYAEKAFIYRFVELTQ